tara:strand:- start:98 stop:793 length:696 start_codon:yes stop_codon:yes gene_type:complete
MSKYTKRQLEERLDILEHENRRYKRAMNQLCIDIDKTVEVNINVNIDRKVHPNENTVQSLKRAEKEWELNVTEPNGGGNWQRINSYIKSTDGIGWTWEDDYVKNGQFAWCGAFAAYCFGDMVNLQVRKNTFPSCYRMNRDWSNSSRVQTVDSILPGDIVVVYTSDDHSPSYGNHITLARTSPNDQGDFHTIEGNAHGVGPDQTWREGVCKRTRNLSKVARVYRLIDEDYNG